MSFKRIAGSYLLAIGAWFALACGLGWQLYLNALTLDPKVSFWDSVWLPVVRFFCYALLTPPIFYVVRHHPIKARHLFRRAVLYGAGWLFFVLGYATLRWSILPPWELTEHRWLERDFAGWIALAKSSFAEQFAMYLMIVALAHAYELFQRSRRQEIETSELQQALAASELQILKIQLHPHFLFNTLHGISTLVDTDPRSAKQMVLKLSSLLRTALKHGSSDLVTLQDEMDFMSDYLELEKMRLGSRLQVRMAIGNETVPLLVPQLILQPLIENAIVHGIACNREGGWLEVSAIRSNGMLDLCVRNSVGGSSRPGTGLGLVNTHARIKCLYGSDATFVFALKNHEFAEARLRLPVFGQDSDSPLRYSEAKVG